jgi:hypothetical protein
LTFDPNQCLLKQTRPQTLIGHLVVLLPFVLFLCAEAQTFLVILWFWFSFVFSYVQEVEPLGVVKVKELTLPSHLQLEMKKPTYTPLWSESKLCALSSVSKFKS